MQYPHRGIDGASFLMKIDFPISEKQAKGFKSNQNWVPSGILEIGKKMALAKSRAIIKGGIIADISRKKTPKAERNKQIPRVSKIKGQRTKGSQRTDNGIAPKAKMIPPRRMEILTIK